MGSPSLSLEQETSSAAPSSGVPSLRQASPFAVGETSMVEQQLGFCAVFHEKAAMENAPGFQLPARHA
jgi:hypothetical protein